MIILTKQEKELIKQAQRNYYKKWRANNKDKVKAANQRYWLKQAQKAQAEQAKEKPSE